MPPEPPFPQVSKLFKSSTLSDKYELTRRGALMSKDVRDLPVVDVFGKFHDQELTDREQ